MKKIKALLLSLIVIPSSLQASWFSEGANAYETINKARHWQAYLAFGLMTALLLSLKHIKEIQRPRIALAVSILIYVGISMSGGFFIAEYFPAIKNLFKGIWYLALSLYDIIEGAL